MYLIQLPAYLNVILLSSIYRHPTAATSYTHGVVVRAGCIASHALCVLSLCRRFVLVLLTFLKHLLYNLC